MKSGPKRTEREMVKAAVLTACRRLIANGENPTISRLVDMLSYGECMIREARAHLVQDGLLALPGGCSNGKATPPDDGVTEIPDDPDRADVEARIAAIRERKASRPKSFDFVMTARITSSRTLPRSRQAVRL